MIGMTTFVSNHRITLVKCLATLLTFDIWRKSLYKILIDFFKLRNLIIDKHLIRNYENFFVIGITQ